MLAKTIDRIETILVDTIARAAVHFSPKHRRKVASILAFLAHDLVGVRRTHVRKMLQEHLKFSLSSACLMSKKIYQAFCENALEMGSIPYLRRDQLEKNIRIDGYSNLLAAAKPGRGIILVSGHFGPWELIPQWLAENGFPVTIVVRRQKNSYLDSWMEFMRHSHGCSTTDSGFGMRKILRTLHKGHCLALMTDQDAGKEGIFVRFLDGWASTPPGPAIIAQKTGAAILPLAIHVQNKYPHRVEIRPPLFASDFPPGQEGAKALTQAYTTILEDWVRKSPEQWFWLHRRWKTQPCFEEKSPI